MEKEKLIYQIEMSNENGIDIPDGLFSWQVFRTQEDAEKWLERNAMEDYCYTIVGYGEDEIEDYEFVEV